MKLALCTILFSLLVVALSCPNGHRNFNIVNNCEFKVWVGEWWQRSGSSGVGGDGWKMNSKEKTSLCVPSSWSGRFWPRTGCNFTSSGTCPGGTPCCETGNCIDKNGKFSLKCAEPGVPPVTLAEFTLVPFGKAPYGDFYDVSLVDGASIPVEIAPTPGTFQAISYDKYRCGNPGCTSKTCPDTFKLSPCSWKFPENEYSPKLRMVTPAKSSKSSECGGRYDSKNRICRCDSSDDCPAGQLCGKRLIPGLGVVSACGNETGWYSANFICSLDSSIGAPLNCRKSVPGQGTNMNLYGCTGPNRESCYSRHANSKCCGCPSWSPKGECQSSNPYWERIAAPTVRMLKNACPTAYSFPYDDPTSTFVCSGKSATNEVDYTVTFCPSGSPHAVN